MLTIFPTSFREMALDPAALSHRHADIAAWLASNEVSYDPNLEDHPFIQVSYDEIGLESLDRILGYANIVNSNQPLGLPYDFTPFAAHNSEGNEFLLYPLAGLDHHLRTNHPEIMERLKGHTSLDSFFASLENQGNDVTAEEYLVLTLTHAIRFCSERKIGLATQW